MIFLFKIHQSKLDRQIQDLEKNKNDWLQRVKNGDSKAIADLYRAYRDNFVQWMQETSNCDEQEALDIFQESVLAVYKNIVANKLTAFNSSIKWYLFGVGKKIYVTHNRKRKVSIESREEVPDIGVVENTPSFRAQKVDTQEQLLTKMLKQMKEPCYTILHLYYYEKQKVAYIAKKLGYKNSNVASIQKVRCIKALRKMFFKKTK